MNTPNPSDLPESLQSAAEPLLGKLSSGMEAAGEKLEAARDVAQEKLQAAGKAASEGLHVAREKIENAGSTVLQWTRENPATALAAVFVSGLAIGCALMVQRHEETFRERLSADPVATLRKALHSALVPLRDGIHDATDSARSAAGRVVDSLKHSQNGHSWNSRLRDLWN